MKYEKAVEEFKKQPGVEVHPVQFLGGCLVQVGQGPGESGRVTVEVQPDRDRERG